MYARCESLVKFDMSSHLNEIERDKADFMANKMSKENATQSKNQTASSKPVDLTKGMTGPNFKKSPFANQKQLNMFLMAFGVVAVVLAVAFLIQCIREVNFEGEQEFRDKLPSPQFLGAPGQSSKV